MRTLYMCPRYHVVINYIHFVHVHVELHIKSHNLGNNNVLVVYIHVYAQYPVQYVIPIRLIMISEKALNET